VALEEKACKTCAVLAKAFTKYLARGRRPALGLAKRGAGNNCEAVAPREPELHHIGPIVKPGKLLMHPDRAGRRSLLELTPRYGGAVGREDGGCLRGGPSARGAVCVVPWRGSLGQGWGSTAASCAQLSIWESVGQLRSRLKAFPEKAHFMRDLIWLPGETRVRVWLRVAAKAPVLKQQTDV
jgi:hypothetical protein